MSFLAPLFWLAALTVAVPILLHLTRREVRRPIPVPSLMFLRRVPFQETRRRQVRNWLLLLLRSLLLLLLVAAFARPVTDRLFSAVNPVASNSTVILLDQSLSMSRAGVWDRALEAAAEEVSGLRDGDEICLVAFGAHSEVVVRWSRQRERVLHALQTGRTSGYEATSYAEGLRQALEQLETATGDRRRIVLVTDLQAAGLDLDRLREAPLAGVELELRDVGIAEANRYVEHLAIPREIFGSRIGISARVARSGTENGDGGDQGAELLLYLESTLAARREVRFGDSQVVTVSFESVEVPEGITRGRVELSPSDSIAADDVRFFVVERVEPFPVFLLSRSGDETGFFEEALAAGENLPFRVERIRSVSQLPPTARIVLVEDAFDQLESARLKPILERGGGIVLAAGNGASHSGTGSLPELMPARLVEKKFSSARGGNFQTLTETSRDHPVFAAFSRAGQNPLNSVQFYGYWGLDPAPGAVVLAQLGDGAPLLLELPSDAGRVMLYASSLDRVWSDFPLRGSYLPFWQSLIQYASGWSPKAADHRVGSAVSLAAWAGATGNRDGWDVLDPAGRRLTSLGGETPSAIQLDRPGFFELRFEKQTDWIAANPDPAESILARITEGEFQAAFNRIRTRQHQDRTGAGPELAGDRGREAIWWLFLAAALGLLVVETLVANRVGAARTQTASPATEQS